MRPLHRQGDNWGRLSGTGSLGPVWCFALQDLFVPAAATAVPAAPAAPAAWFSLAP